MIKLRSSVLVIWVLVATFVAVIGIDAAVAAGFRGRDAFAPSRAPVRRVIGPCTGEPDNGNNGAPPKSSTPTMLAPVGGSWIFDQVFQWTWKQQFRRASRTR